MASLLRSVLLACSAFVLLATCRATYLPDVKPAEFDQQLDPSKASILVEFYAPWCGHCKNLAPEFEKLGKAFENAENVVIAQVDADKYPKLGEKFQVTGFPTVKWIPKGKTFADAEDVRERNSEGLINFVNDNTGLKKKEASSHVIELNEATFDKVALDPKRNVLVGFFAPWCGHCKSMKPTWEKLATVYEGVASVEIASVDADKYKSLAKTYSVTGFPTLKFFGVGAEVEEEYGGGRDLESMIAFINKKAGTDIAADGGVMPEGGVVGELAEVVKSIRKASSESEIAALAEQCAKTVEGLGEVAKNNFKYYERVFKKIAANGAEYVKKEQERLGKILEAQESLQTESRRMFMRRMNVLKQFDEL